MFVYVLNNNNIPVKPCLPAIARKLLNSGEAVLYKKSPFIIKLLSTEEPKTKNVLNINFTVYNIEFFVISDSGDIYYTKCIDYTNEKAIDNIKEIFVFIQTFIPFYEIYFMINSSAFFVINKSNNSEYKFVDFSFNITNCLFKDVCFICGEDLIKNEYKIYKIIRNLNFDGNSLFVCRNCYKKLLENPDHKYIKAIRNIYNLGLLVKDNYKEGTYHA